MTEDTLQTLADALGNRHSAPKPDSILTSAMRGRLLAALSAGLGLWVTARSAWQSVEPMLDAGMGLEDVAAIVGHLNVVLTATDAALVAATGVVSLGAALWSKLRARR